MEDISIKTADMKMISMESKNGKIRRKNNYNFVHKTLKALDFAMTIHKYQFRKDGITPYITHPIQVVNILYSWGIFDPTTISIAYLHDVIEDVDISYQSPEKLYKQLIFEFGTFIANGVKLLSIQSNETKVEYISRISRSTFRMYLLYIKAADRIHNTYCFLNEGKADYAKIYLHKADEIFNTIKNSKNDEVLINRISFERYRLLGLMK